jgi:hypothetical protein
MSRLSVVLLILLVHVFYVNGQMCFGNTTTWNGRQTVNVGCSSLGFCQANDYCICTQGYYQNRCDQGTCNGTLMMWGQKGKLAQGDPTDSAIAQFPGFSPIQCSSRNETRQYTDYYKQVFNFTYYFNQSCGEDIVSITFGEAHSCFLAQSRKGNFS